MRDFDGDDEKWPGGWYKLQSFLKPDHTGYKALIENIVQETDSTKLINVSMDTADKKLSSSLYYVHGLPMTDKSKSLKIVRDVSVLEGAIALHRLLAEYQPDVVNRHSGLLMSTIDWTIRTTAPITAIHQLDLKITAYEEQSTEKMADAVKRGVLLKGLALLAQVQNHVMKDSTRLSCYERMS